MARIAVYDKFYLKDRSRDIVSEALQDSPHQVIARAYRIRDAVAQILDFKDGPLEGRPDIVILGHRLKDEDEYKHAPTTISEPCIIRRKWLSRDIEGARTTFLLPHHETGPHKYYFPTVEGAHPRLPSKTARQWESLTINVAAPVLSRLVETYLPDTVRLGVSSEIMFDSVLHQTVLRHQDDAAQQMQDCLRWYGNIADRNRGQQSG